MSKGLSPIIATMILVGITISIGTIVSIWLNAQSQEYMAKEGERRERILNKEGESLVLIHIAIDGNTGDLSFMLQNNGTSDLEVAYVKINEYYRGQNVFCTTPSDCQISYNESKSFTIVSGDLPGAIGAMKDIGSLEVGTTLGRLFIFNAPSPQIRVTNTFFEYGNRLFTFSGEGSVDDGKIVKWEWCFDYDKDTGEECECKPNEVCNPGDPLNRAYGFGEVTSYNYADYNTTPPNDKVYIWLKVTDETGMVGIIFIEVDISAT